MIPSLKFPLVQQLAAFVLSGFTLDYGTTLRICGFAVIAYWAGIALILLRRGRKISETDRFFIRWGFVWLFIIAIPVAGMVWQARGA